MKKIVIDVVPLYAGQGGSGGGIWTFAKQLLLNLDQLCANDQEHKFYCLVNEDFNLPLKHIEIVRFHIDTRGILKRLLYIHVLLPWYCWKNNVDVLHKLASEIPLLSSPSLVVSVMDFMPEFYLEKGYDIKKGLINKLGRRYFVFITRHALRRSKRIITISKSVREEVLTRYRIAPAKVEAAPLATEINLSEPRVRNTASKEVSFFSIAAYLPHKGHFHTIDLFELMVQKYGLKASLSFRGNSHNQEFYQRVVDRVAHSPVKDRIHLVEYDRSSTLADIYAQADFMILLSEYEGFGLPVLEAQSFNVPVICSDITVFREIAEDSATFVNYNNLDESARRITRLVQSTSEQEGMIEKGRLNTLNFSWMKCTEKIYHAYINVLRS